MTHKLYIVAAAACWPLLADAQGLDHPVLRSPTVFFDTSPWGVCAVDMDKDGRLDIVTALDGRSLAIAYGTGDGFFGSPQLYPSVEGIHWIATADFNNDGWIDVAGNVEAFDQVGVFLNDTTGGLEPPVFYQVGLKPRRIESADLDNDGWFDLVVPNYHGKSVSVLLNDGSGSFVQAVDYPVGEDVFTLALADYDGDNDLDLAVGHDSHVTVLSNDGGGLFTYDTTYESGGGLIEAMLAIDLNDDEAPDLCVVSRRERQVSIFTNAGDGSFINRVEIAVGGNPRDIEAVDWNDDNATDLLIMETGSGQYVLLQNDGAGAMSIVDRMHANASITALATGDVNEDGAIDVLVSEHAADSIWVHLADGEGIETFWASDVFGAAETGFIADFDADSHWDIVIDGLTDRRMRAFLGDGQGRLHPPSEYLSNTELYGITAADFDNDGAADVVCAAESSDFDGAHFFWNDGLGDFTAQSTVMADGARGVHAVDIDGDNLIDLVIPTIWSNEIHVLHNLGNRSFDLKATLSSANLPVWIESIDFDRDGDHDLLVTGFENDRVELYDNDGAGELTLIRSMVFGTDPAATLVADLDDDGWEDVLIADRMFHGVHIVQNMKGTLTPVEHLQLPAEPFDLVMGDVNLDGRDDLIVAMHLRNALAIALRTRSGGFGPFRYYAAGQWPRWVGVADADGDGDADVWTINRGHDRVAIQQNPARENVRPASIDSFTVTFGSLLSGELSDLLTSDNSYVRIQSQFGFSAIDANIIEVHFELTDPIATAQAAYLEFEHGLNNPGGRARVRLQRWNGPVFDTIAQYPIDVTESVQTVWDVDLAEYRHPTSGAIQMSWFSAVTATFSVEGFEARVDRVSVGLFD